ncbi:Protein cwh43 [Friedmanniomyces endolithicus]|nr:Protein cwh43 [Friedmanniomyces endolithicus]KAK0293463.1 Protein cwh43 [Friedmanniomyces endolithicus]KAK0997395.1 Protein cwh43 [Friedmanniomyces endolithicus]
MAILWPSYRTLSPYFDRTPVELTTHQIPGQYVSHAHTLCAYAAFLGALFVGLSLHYKKIVENEHFGYPTEWFPSVSSTIGDRYPERSVFQIFIAMTSGPRFALVYLNYLLTKRPGSSAAKWVAGVGVFRTLTCGGWTYVTSTDDHNWHDYFMVSYLVASIPWTLGCLALSPPNHLRTVWWRKWLAGGFFATLVPMLYFFLQHKIHRVPGAYTIYALFEWSLVLIDVGFDAVTALDFQSLEIVIKDVKGLSRGDSKRAQDTFLETQKDNPIGQVFDPQFRWGEMLDAVADVYIGFIFWSVITSLGLVCWYFPLWHMGLSGYEIAILSSISPFLLGIPAFRRHIADAMPGSYLLNGLAGLLAYLVVSPEWRLATVSAGVWTGCLGLVGSLWRDKNDAAKLEARISAWAIGLIASSIAKFAFWTNNPVWPIMNAENGGWNKTGIALFLVAIGRLYLRTPAMAANPSSAPKHEKPTKGPSALASLGFGGLMFALHYLLSDSSTIILWTWSGFPVRGPLAVPHGAWTIATMGLGLMAGLFYPKLVRTWTAFGIGSVGAAVLTYCENWTGYYGGLAITLYVTAVAPILVSNAIKFPPGRTFGLGFLVYNFILLFSIWVVAYAFVPGGPLVRERTDWVMATMMLLLGCGVFSALQNGTGSTPGVEMDSKRTFYPPPNPAAKRQRSYYIYILLSLQLLSASIAYLRFPPYNYQPYHPDSKVITAGIWTVHFSIDNDMWSSERRMESLIRESELDLIGLLESDNQRIIMGMRDTTQYLAEELGMWVDQGPGPDKNTWGCALLSKFPIVNSTHHLTPSPAGELAPAIHAVIDAYGELVDVYVFHSGQEEDVEDRKQQSEYMSNLMGQSSRPAILLSYLVMEPGKGNYNTWVSEKSGMRDIDPSDWDRWCEYILYKNLRRSGYARLSRGTVTDTELQVGRFVVGQPEDLNAGLVPEAEVPQDMRFPSLFKGEGVRGHFYHVFDEPRYYA